MPHTELSAKHIDYLDKLRILAAFMVMLVHTAAQDWYNGNATDLAWQVRNLYDAICRPAVALFLMISGVLLLRQRQDLKKIYTKYIPRIAMAFVFWSIVYVVCYPTPKLNFLTQLLKGALHLWYCYTIIGLYICLPIISKIAENKITLQYFLAALFIPCFCLHTAAYALSMFSGNAGAIAEGIFAVLGCFFKGTAFWAIFYFLLGYYIYKTDFSKMVRYCIYATGLAGTALTVFLTWYATMLAGSPTEMFYHNNCLNVALEAVAIFVFAKYNFKSCVLAEKISRYSFGAYLVHMLFISKLYQPFKSLGLLTSIEIPALALIVFFLSYSATALLGRIPLLKRFVL